MRSLRRRNGLLFRALRGIDPVNPLAFVTRVLILSLLLAVPAWSESDEVVWEPAQVLDAEQIAASGAFVPLAIPTFFDNFRYPFLQEDESVVFIANDHMGPRDGIGRHGIFRITKEGGVGKLAEAGDYFKGTTARLTGVSGLRVDRGRAVFSCSADDGSGGVGLVENGDLHLLIRTGDTNGFTNIGYPGYAGNTVTFYAEGLDERGSVYAVDLASERRPLRKVIDHTTTIPGRASESFGSFGFQQEADDGFAVFRGFAVGARELRQRTGGPEHALGGVFRQDIHSSIAPEKIIDTLTQLPGGPPGATFAELQTALPRDGTVVVSSWSGDHEGLYYIGRDGKPRLVADTNTRIPELIEGTFTGFDKWAANCTPWVLFIAQAGAYRGLFAMHMERNELFLLLDTQTELGGKMVADVELSSRPKLDENIVMAITFADESSGIYLLKFGDGWGKAIFRRGESTAGESTAGDSGAADEVVATEKEMSTAGGSIVGETPAEAAAPTIELLEEGSFLMIGDSHAHDAPEAATGKTNMVDEAELLQSGSVFSASKGLNFGYRYNLHSPGDNRCNVEGFDMFIVHPPIKGPDGQWRTTSTIPMKVCFNDGKAEDFLIYGLEEDYEVLPGSWTLQVRKDGQVLISRSFTLL